MITMRVRYARTLIALAFCWALAGQERDLTSLTLEEFLNVEVTSVDKTPRKLSRSAAAVFVITNEDIRRSGANSLPEVLRMVPGVHVAHVTGTEWAISIRGFSNIYSNKLLVMIDGRPVYNALLSGTLWDENMVMLDDVERIEVIRGPGATMWGANAVTGVINVISKDARATTGGMLGVTAGTFDPGIGRLRYGATTGDNAAWRVWGQYSLYGQPTNANAMVAPNPWKNPRAGFRLDWQIRPQDSLLVEGEAMAVRAPTPFVSGGEADTRTNGGYVMARWTHTNLRGDETELQVSEGMDSIDAGLFTSQIGSLDLDVQHKIQLPAGHILIVGGGARSNAIETKGTTAFDFDPADRTYRVVNGFVQDEWDVLPDKLLLTGGVKLEHYSRAGSSVQPTARVMWTPTRRQGYWASVSRAVRIPSHVDYTVRFPFVLAALPLPVQLMGSDDYQPEVLNAAEAGGRFRIGRSWAVDLTAFHHRYSGLYSFSVPLSATGFPTLITGITGGPVIPALTSNAMDGRNRGVEGVLHYDVRPGWQISGSYSNLFAATSFRAGFNALNSFALESYTPKHQWQVHSSWTVRRNWNVDAALFRVGSLPGGVLPAHSRADLRVGRRFGEMGEVFISGQNLLRRYEQELSGELLYSPGLVRRSIDAGFRWNF